MKKITSLLLACVLLVGCVLTLSGCVLSLGSTTLLMGEYEADWGVVEVTYEFTPFGKVTAKVDSVVGDSVYEGEYEIKDGKITIDLDDGDLYECDESDFSSGEEDGVKYIKIGLIKYTEVD